MKLVFMGDCQHEIKTTRMRDGWGVRCLTNGFVNQEIQVQTRQDIGVAAAEMLRMEDKCGNISKMASASRERFFKGDKYRRFTLPVKHIPI